MSQPVSKVPLKETNNYPQGKSGSKVTMKDGPATGKRGHVNPTKGGGGIFRAPKSN